MKCVIHIKVTSHCRNVINMFATAEGLLTQQDRLNPDGLQEVFATNLFGHFFMVPCSEDLHNIRSKIECGHKSLH